MTTPLAADAEAAALKALMLRHVSLGMNCELGIVQRACGAEPLDLLRFALTPLDGLIGQLGAGFAAFADVANLSIEPDSGGWEYIAREPQSEIKLHTNILVKDRPETGLHAREGQRIGRLARKLLTELSTGSRTAVYCRGYLTEAVCIRLHDALLRHGPVRLFAVTQAPSRDMIGSVVKPRDRLTIGYLDRVTPVGYAAHPSLDLWLALLRLSERLLADPRATCAGVVRPSARDREIPRCVAKWQLWQARAARRQGDTNAALAAYRAYLCEVPNDPEAAEEARALSVGA